MSAVGVLYVSLNNMPSLHLQTSSLFREYNDIDKKEPKLSSEVTPSYLRWRADIIDSYDKGLWLIFTNEVSLYSIVFEDSGEDILDTFYSRFDKLVCPYNLESKPSLLFDSKVNQSLIASMNNARLLVELQLDRNLPVEKINERPYKPLGWATPTEAMHKLLETKLG